MDTIRVIELGGTVYKLSPPRGWALDLMAQWGIDYLNPEHPFQRPVIKDGGLVRDEAGDILYETAYSPVPLDMGQIRVVGITMAALLSQSAGLDAERNPVKVWTPEEMMDLIAPQQVDQLSRLCADLVNAAFPERAESNPPQPLDAQPGDERPSSAHESSVTSE